MLLPKVLAISRSWIAVELLVIPFPVEDFGTPLLLLSDLSTLWKHDPSDETKLIFKIGLNLDVLTRYPHLTLGF